MSKQLKNFVAIDFETATAKRSSICSVGIVIVKNGIMVEKIYKLIKPKPHKYEPIPTSIHGITKEDTKHTQNFKDAWQDIAPKIKGLPLLAHSAKNEESHCLEDVYKIYEMRYPKYKFVCTKELSQKFYPELKNKGGYGLKNVAKYLGIELTKHHDALADAEACALIAMKIFLKSN